jgi:hypothetical protein
MSSFLREITEAALSRHWQRRNTLIGSDPLEKRRKLMDAWVGYCEPRMKNNVVLLKRAK